MLRNIKLVGVLVSLGVLSSLPVNAAIFNDISISGDFNSSPISFTPPNPVDVTNGAYDFSSVLPINAGANANLFFDFEEYAGGLNLRAIVDGVSTFGFSLAPFSVTFTNIINSTPGSYFTSIQLLQDSDYDGSNVFFSDVTISNFVEDPLHGISFTLVFDEFHVAGYSRNIELELGYGNINDNTPSVVPVPAAAPMALLGLGVLALARRFRRAKS